MSKNKYPPYHIYPGTIDSHIHLLHMEKKGQDLDDFLKRIRDQGFSYLLDAGVDEENFSQRLSLKDHYPLLFFSAGIHPEGAEADMEMRIGKIAEQLDNRNVIALGEIGLDYYWKDRTPENQRDLFAKQLQLAGAKDLPVIIHNREADEDCLSLLKANRTSRGGVMHCFSSTVDFARQVLDLGFYISFAGNVTYGSAQAIQETARFVPEDRILVETDAPYLSPQKRRGKPNHSGHLGYTIDFIGELRKEDPRDLIPLFRGNFERLFFGKN